MPKGEFDTPGPFTMKRISRWTRYIYWRQHLALTVATGQDEAEGEEMLGLLNKGTHFEAMKAALDEALSVMRQQNVLMPVSQETIDITMEKMWKVLAAAEGRGDV